MQPKATITHIKSIRIKTAAALLWENAWPRLAPLFIVISLYAIIAWASLWPLIPPILSKAIAYIFIAAAALSIAHMRHIKWPRSAEITKRIEAASKLPHRPLSTSLDQLPNGAKQQERALWQAHQARMAQKLQALRSATPRPQMAEHDPYAIRTFLILGLFITAIGATGEHWQRLITPFKDAPPSPPLAARIDAWITPPNYTAKAPIFLTKSDRLIELNLPTNSILTIRTVTQSPVTVSLTDINGDDIALEQKPEGEANLIEQVLTQNGNLQIADRTWPLTLIPDTPPSIAFIGTPTHTISGALEITAALKDDYGIVSAKANVEPTNHTITKTSRPLYQAPNIPLTLNRSSVAEGRSKTVTPLAEHPWAGASVTITLQAKDGANQSGTSNSLPFILPQKRFTNPIAKALIEQRRALALDAHYKYQLIDILDLILVNEQAFDKTLGAYTALTVAKRRTIEADEDKDLRSVVDLLWEIATGLEDGDLTEAQKALRDALEALKEGIKNGVSEQELAQLMENARQAMQDFTRSLAQQAERNGEKPPQAQQNNQTLSQKDLEKMLDEIEKMAQSGARDTAEQMVSRLQQMMENMQAQNGQQGESPEQKALNELGDMIRKQQQLMDETFREQQKGTQLPQEGQPQQEQMQQDREQAMEELRQGQQALNEQLQALQDQLNQNGTPSNDELGKAGEAMGKAESALGKGNPRIAGQNQSSALEALREGANKLSEQFANGQGQGQGGQGQNGQQNANGSDPLGRAGQGAGPNFGDDIKVPEEIEAQRARRLLETIRRKLENAQRPRQERQYLERLLERE